MARVRAGLAAIAALLALSGTLSTSTVARAAVHTASAYYGVIVTLHTRARTYARVALAGQSVRRAWVYPRRATRLRYHHVKLAGGHAVVHAHSSHGPISMSVRIVAGRTPKKKKTTTPAPTPAPAAAPAPAPAPAPTPTPAATAPAPPANPYPALVWSDEFAGSAGSAPNPNNWTYDSGGTCGGSTPYTNTQSTANASLDGNGHLAITALDTNGNYTSAQLDSVGHFSSQYGSIQASIELPAGAGLCSAFWMIGDGSPTPATPCWPGCGEIDILEALSQLPNYAIFTMHGPTSDGSATFQQFESVASTLPDLTAGFHTYGLTWTPATLTWTVDGVACASETKAQLIAANGPDAWVYDRPFHIILDLAVGNWAQSPDATTPFPAKLLVDWVRVYGP